VILLGTFCPGEEIHGLFGNHGRDDHLMGMIVSLLWDR
jgi:hypothetical protein